MLFTYTEEMYPLVATVLTLHSLQTEVEVITVVFVVKLLEQLNIGYVS